MIEAAGWIVEVLVSKKVDVDAVLGFVYLGNLGQDKKEGVKMQVQKRQIVKLRAQEDKDRKHIL